MSEVKKKGKLVSVKSVKQDKDLDNRDRVVLTLGEDKRGINGLDELIAVLSEIREKNLPAKLDVRIGEQQSRRGTTFPTAFIIVSEVLPLDQYEQQQQQKSFKPVASRTDKMKQQASRVREAMEE